MKQRLVTTEGPMCCVFVYLKKAAHFLVRTVHNCSAAVVPKVMLHLVKTTKDNKRQRHHLWTVKNMQLHIEQNNMSSQARSTYLKALFSVWSCPLTSSLQSS